MNTTIPTFLALAGLGGVLGLGTLFLVDRFTRLRGTLKLLHVLAPYGFNRADIPDLTGQTFIVTGANSGLGLGCAKELAIHGADVIMAVRNTRKGEEAKRNIGQVKGTLTVMELDNMSLASVKRFANSFKALNRPLNGLILNAGIMSPPFDLTEDGIESQFGVNHVAHFALTKDLLGLLQSSEPSTVVSVASLAHWFSVPPGVYPELSLINNQSKYNRASWYGQSKLANILFAKELTRRLGPSSKVFVNAVHPGGVQGNLNRHILGGNALFRTIDAIAQNIFYWTCEEAALTVLYPAVSPDVIKKNLKGQYFVPIARLDPGSDQARDAGLAERVWELTEQILKEKGWDNMQ